MFDLGAYLDRCNIDPRLLEFPAGRRALTELDPLLFALLYLPHHLKIDGGFSFSEFHGEFLAEAKRWALPVTEPRSERDAYVAPRSAGKTTLCFLVAPMWAAAHEHQKFIAAFADSATQAEMHLATFRNELERNALLRLDFPELCTPARKLRGTAEADNTSMYRAKSGFTFVARGVDSRNLGMKVGEDRPSLILLDDVEPPEETYSPAIKDKRLGALTDSILPLNELARVVLVGTVTMEGSIVHDLVLGEEKWIADQRFRTHYYPALITDEQTGEERSLWPEKWPLDYLKSIEHTRDFLKNFQNSPMGRDGRYWTAEDFTYGELSEMTGQMLSIDPAVTSKAKSDDTALAVIGSQKAKYEYVDGHRVEIEPSKCAVLYAEARRIQVGEPLRQWVIAVLGEFPRVLGVLIEVNQGGDAWLEILHDIGVPVRVVHNSLPKEVRAARLLARYQVGRVLHAKRFPKAEGQMVGFPKAPHDDLVDAIGNGVNVYLKQNETSSRETGRTDSYV